MRKFGTTAAALMLALTIIGCGGGGGGTTGGATPETLDADNAVATVFDTESSLGNSLDSADEGLGIDVERVTAAFGGQAALPVPGYLAEAATALSEALSEPGFAREAALARTINPALVLPDRCGDGTMTITGTVTRTLAAYDLDVTVVFDNFDNCRSIIDGTFDVVLAATPMATSATYTATDLYFDTPGKDATLDGTIAFDSVNLGWDPQTGQFEFDLTWTSGLRVLRLSNLVITFDKTDDLYHNLVTLDGGLYFNNKKVTVTTNDEIGFEADEEHPSTGQYQLDGNGRLRVTYLSADELRIEVDVDEDGGWVLVFEGTWEEFYTLAGYPSTGEGALTITDGNALKVSFAALTSFQLTDAVQYSIPNLNTRSPVALAKVPGFVGPGFVGPGSAVLGEILPRLLPADGVGRVAPLDLGVVEINQEFDAVCGEGTGYVTGTITPQIGGTEYNLSLVFDQYTTCVGLDLTGGMTYVSLQNQNTIDATFGMANLNATYTALNATFTMDGNVTLVGDYATNEFTLTANYTWFFDDVAVELEDFVIWIDETISSAVLFTVDGVLKVGDKEVTVATVEEIVINLEQVDPQPEAGVFTVDGDGFLTVTFGAPDDYTVQVQLDANEDGDLNDQGDYDSTALTWVEYYQSLGFVLN